MANVLYLGLSGFPLGLAAIQKQLLISKSLQEAGGKVFILCRRAVHSENKYTSLPDHYFEGVYFKYTSRPPFYHKNFLLRNISKQFNKFFEILEIFKICKTIKIDAAIIKSRNSFSDALYYRLISKIFHFKIYINLEEYYFNRKGTPIKRRINDFLFNKYFTSIYDGILPISEMLIDIVKRRKPDLPYLKIPVLVDHDKILKIKKHEASFPYFLFCGAADYSEVIEFIIKAFNKLDYNGVHLYLILNGIPDDLNIIKAIALKTSKGNNIHFFEKLSQDDLYAYYKGAIGLLIPLRDTLQDNARFPHKIGEYLSSGRPVITSNVGEIKKYFTDHQTAFISGSYDIDLFAGKMSYVLKYPDKAEEVALNGKVMAQQIFNYKSYSAVLNDFLDQR
jgi:glycosyltransferase involved in cell wall biosynthesis